jgi:hypothetical protein
MNDDIDDDAARRESDELRALWSALPPPRAGADSDGLPSEDLSSADDMTRAAVERLRAAWAAHTVDVHEVPFALRRANAARRAPTVPRARRARRSLAPRMLALAGAAAVATALIVLALRNEREAGTPERANESSVAIGAGELRRDGSAEAPRAVERSAVQTEPVATLVEIPREDFKLRADGFEFEAQGVRFVLIENTGDAPSGAPATKSH